MPLSRHGVSRMVGLSYVNSNDYNVRSLSYFESRFAHGPRSDRHAYTRRGSCRSVEYGVKQARVGHASGYIRSCAGF